MNRLVRDQAIRDGEGKLCEECGGEGKLLDNGPSGSGPDCWYCDGDGLESLPRWLR